MNVEIFKTKPITVEENLVTVVSIDLGGSAIEPAILSHLNPPKIDGTKGVVLEGRGPIWLYSYLVHSYHATAWIGVYDPRIGVVVVESHSPRMNTGDIFKISL